MVGTDSDTKRVALVIANAAYRIGRPLINPVNDARVIIAALGRLGFYPIISRSNLSLIEMGRAFADFAMRADESDMAVIYFAGHGMEVGGENYLLPVDANPAHVRRLPHEAKKLSDVVEMVGGAKELGLIILDACRNNPYRGRMGGLENVRSMSDGLGDITPRGNTLVAYAAAPGTLAKDGPEGGNSPYVQALQEHIETPDLDVLKMFGKVRDGVLELTKNSQVPHISGTVGGNSIYLKKSPPRLDVKEANHFDPGQMEHFYWKYIKNSADIELFEEYLRRFEGGIYVPLARLRLSILQSEADRCQQTAQNTSETNQANSGKASINNTSELAYVDLKTKFNQYFSKIDKRILMIFSVFAVGITLLSAAYLFGGDKSASINQPIAQSSSQASEKSSGVSNSRTLEERIEAALRDAKKLDARHGTENELAESSNPEDSSNKSSGFFVQLFARNDPRAAKTAFDDLQKEYSPILGKYSLGLREVDLDEKGLWYRGLVGPFTSKIEADELCEQLKASGMKGCFSRKE